MTESTELLISLSIESDDPSELDELTRQLRSEIEELNVDAVENVSQGDAPDGTKAVEWVELGNFVVSLAPIVVPSLFDVLKSYIERKPSVPVKIKVKVGRNKTAEIEYDPTKTSAEDLDKLIKSLSKPVKK
jgi:hypothetical protein